MSPNENTRREEEGLNMPRPTEIAGQVMGKVKGADGKEKLVGDMRAIHCVEEGCTGSLLMSA